jgi:hypothetical protein
MDPVPVLILATATLAIPARSRFPTPAPSDDAHSGGPLLLELTRMGYPIDLALSLSPGPKKRAFISVGRTTLRVPRRVALGVAALAPR